MDISELRDEATGLANEIDILLGEASMEGIDPKKLEALYEAEKILREFGNQPAATLHVIQ